MGNKGKFILNPKTNRYVKMDSKKGKEIIKNKEQKGGINDTELFSKIEQATWLKDDGNIPQNIFEDYIYIKKGTEDQHSSKYYFTLMDGDAAFGGPLFSFPIDTNNFVEFKKIPSQNDSNPVFEISPIINISNIQDKTKLYPEEISETLSGIKPDTAKKIVKNLYNMSYVDNNEYSNIGFIHEYFKCAELSRVTLINRDGCASTVRYLFKKKPFPSHWYLLKEGKLTDNEDDIIYFDELQTHIDGSEYQIKNDNAWNNITESNLLNKNILYLYLYLLKNVNAISDIAGDNTYYTELYDAYSDEEHLEPSMEFFNELLENKKDNTDWNTIKDLKINIFSYSAKHELLTIFECIKRAYDSILKLKTDLKKIKGEDVSSPPVSEPVVKPVSEPDSEPVDEPVSEPVVIPEITELQDVKSLSYYKTDEDRKILLFELNETDDHNSKKYFVDILNYILDGFGGDLNLLLETEVIEKLISDKIKQLFQLLLDENWEGIEKLKLSNKELDFLSKKSNKVQKDIYKTIRTITDKSAIPTEDKNTNVYKRSKKAYKLTNLTLPFYIELQRRYIKNNKKFKDFKTIYEQFIKTQFVKKYSVLRKYPNKSGKTGATFKEDETFITEEQLKQLVRIEKKEDGKTYYRNREWVNNNQVPIALGPSNEYLDYYKPITDNELVELTKNYTYNIKYRNNSFVSINDLIKNFFDNYDDNMKISTEKEVPKTTFDILSEVAPQQGGDTYNSNKKIKELQNDNLNKKSIYIKNLTHKKEFFTKLNIVNADEIDTDEIITIFDPSNISADDLKFFLDELRNPTEKLTKKVIKDSLTGYNNKLWGKIDFTENLKDVIPKKDGEDVGLCHLCSSEYVTYWDEFEDEDHVKTLEYISQEVINELPSIDVLKERMNDPEIIKLIKENVSENDITKHKYKVLRLNELNFKEYFIFSYNAQNQCNLEISIIELPIESIEHFIGEDSPLLKDGGGDKGISNFSQKLYKLQSFLNNTDNVMIKLLDSKLIMKYSEDFNKYIPERLCDEKIIYTTFYEKTFQRFDINNFCLSCFLDDPFNNINIIKLPLRISQFVKFRNGKIDELKRIINLVPSIDITSLGFENPNEFYETYKDYETFQNKLGEVYKGDLSKNIIQIEKLFAEGQAKHILVKDNQLYIENKTNLNSIKCSENLKNNFIDVLNFLSIKNKFNLKQLNDFKTEITNIFKNDYFYNLFNYNTQIQQTAQSEQALSEALTETPKNQQKINKLQKKHEEERRLYQKREEDSIDYDNRVTFTL